MSDTTELNNLRAARIEAIREMAEAKTVIGAIWHALGIPADADADIVAEVRALVARDKPGCSWAHEELATVEAERDALAGLLAEQTAAAEARGRQQMIDALRERAASLASLVARGTWGWAYSNAADYLDSIANQATPAQEETAT